MNYRSVFTQALQGCILTLTVIILPLLLIAPKEASATDELTTIKTLLSGQNIKSAVKEESALPIERIIETESNATDDKKIKTRLKKIYGELESMRGVGISEVSNGVVTLVGKVETSAILERALQFARQVEGVVEVKHKIVVDRSLRNRLAQTRVKILSIVQDMIVNLPLFLLGFVVIWLFWTAGAFLSRWQPFIKKFAPNDFIGKLLSQLFQLLFLLVGIILAFTILDATAVISTILGAAGILGLAISFAVRDTVENYIASILLSLRNPFEPNDLVKIDVHTGYVARLTSRATILISREGSHIRIPNATVFKATIINYTRNPQRRFNFQIGVDSASDLLKVQSIAMKILEKQPGLLQEPAPSIIIEELGNSNIVFNIFAWVDQSHYDWSRVRSETIRQVKEAFDKVGIAMPEPIYQVKIQGQALPANTTQKKAQQTNNQQKTTQSSNNKSALPTQPDISRDDSIDKQLAQEQENSENSTNLLTPEAPME